MMSRALSALLILISCLGAANAGGLVHPTGDRDARQEQATTTADHESCEEPQEDAPNLLEAGARRFAWPPQDPTRSSHYFASSAYRGVDLAGPRRPPRA